MIRSTVRMVVATVVWIVTLYLLLVVADEGGWVRFGVALVVCLVALAALLFTLADLEDAHQ